MTSFLVDNFFKNLHPSFKMYSLLFVFFFLCLCFCFLSCFFFKIEKIKKFPSDYLGGKKGVLPHLNYWGRVPGLPPRVYAHAHMGRVWRIIWGDYFQPKGRGFDSRSSRHVGTLGKSFTCSCLCFGVKLRYSIRAVVGSASE